MITEKVVGELWITILVLGSGLDFRFFFFIIGLTRHIQIVFGNFKECEKGRFKMDLNSWVTFFKIISFVGAFLVFMSTIGVWYFTSRIDKIKDGKIEELIKGKNELISQTQERDKEQRVILEKIDKKLDKLVDAGAISKETAKEIKTIYSETLKVDAKASISIKDELIPAKKPSVENK